MLQTDNFAAELAEAEADIVAAEATYGKDNIKVSYALDKAAGLLRSKKIRTLDAANMTARAKAIRVKHHQGENVGDENKKLQIQEAIKISSERVRKQREKQKVRQLVAVSIFLLGVAQTVFLPTPEEKEFFSSITESTKNVKVDSLAGAGGLMSNATASAKAAAAKQQQHSSDTDKIISNVN